MSAGPLRKLAAVLYADVAGYSRLTAEDEEGTHRRLAEALDLFAGMISARRGRVRHFAGDAVLADFATASDALGCALAIQRRLEARNAPLPEERRLSFRIGLNLGEVIDDRGDVYGDGVNIAARLEALAPAGGICVSDALRTAVGRRVPAKFEDLGACEVKNIPEPVRAWRVRDDGGRQASGREAAILRAEAKAYRVLMDESDARFAREALDRARQVVVAQVEAHGGTLAEAPADTLVAVFEDAAACSACALAAQAAMVRFNEAQAPADRVRYRFGTDVGEVIEADEGVAGEAAEGAVRAVSAARFQEGAPPGPPQLEALDFPLPAQPSITLLPFSVMGDDPETAAIADGLRLDIQNALVKMSQILLIAAGTANHFRGAPAQRAAPRVGARYALEGSVRRAGNNLRVNAQLTDMQGSVVVWSERYDRTFDQSFTVQDEITERIVTALDVRLSSGEQARIWRKCLTDPLARQHYYEAMQAFFKMNPEAIATAKARFESVAKHAPDSALGPSGVALCLWFEATRGWAKNPQEAREQAGVWAERGVAKEDTDGQAHTILGNVRLLQGRHDEALEIARQSVLIRPGCTNANGFLANVLLHCGEFDDAAARAKRAMRISPVFPPWYLEILAAAYREAGEVRLATTAAQEAARIVAQSVHSRAILASALVRGGWTAEARRVARELASLDPRFAAERYAALQPFRHREVPARLAAELREAGLP